MLVDDIVAGKKVAVDPFVDAGSLWGGKIEYDPCSPVRLETTHNAVNFCVFGPFCWVDRAGYNPLFDPVGDGVCNLCAV